MLNENLLLKREFTNKENLVKNKKISTWNENKNISELKTVTCCGFILYPFLR